MNGECERGCTACGQWWIPQAVVTPWRGALLFGLEGLAFARCAELGNKVGALKIAQRGPQNYVLDFTPD